jgi:hypothetical protein
MLLNTRITFNDELSVFLLSFPPQFWLILNLLDPDPHSECGSGSRKPIECGSNADPDSKHCIFHSYLHPVLRIQIQDPVPFYPKDLGSGYGMIFFRIPYPYHVSNSRFYFEKWRKTGKIKFF